ncbi:MAG TPA: hypothetical protein VH682_30455 [Gemmataceae bacterium]|jgi:hypothetical protein
MTAGKLQVRILKTTPKGQEEIGRIIFDPATKRLSAMPDGLRWRLLLAETLAVPASLRKRYGGRVDSQANPLAWLKILRYSSSSYVRFTAPEEMPIV